MLWCHGWGSKPPLTASPNHGIYSKCLSSLRCCGWAYGYTLMPCYMCRWGWIIGKMGMADSVWCCGVMVEAANPQRLHPNFILDVYKVFEQLEMPWVGIWVHPHAVLHVLMGVNIRGNGVWLSLFDVVVSWLRQQTPIDCIPIPYWMYTQCLSSLRCCGWAYMGTHLCRIACADGGEY